MLRAPLCPSYCSEVEHVSPGDDGDALPSRPPPSVRRAGAGPSFIAISAYRSVEGPSAFHFSVGERPLPEDFAHASARDLDEPMRTKFSFDSDRAPEDFAPPPVEACWSHQDELADQRDALSMLEARPPPIGLTRRPPPEQAHDAVLVWNSDDLDSPGGGTRSILKKSGGRPHACGDSGWDSDRSKSVTFTRFPQVVEPGRPPTRGRQVPRDGEDSAKVDNNILWHLMPGEH